MFKQRFGDSTQKSFFQKLKTAGIFIVGLLILIAFSQQALASVSGTSTPVISPYFQNKVKENSDVPVLKIELTATAGELLSSITVTVATSTNATPTPLSSSSFERLSVFKDGDDNQILSPGDTLLASSTVNIGTTSTVSISTSTPAEGVFFVVLKTASTSTFSDNGFPDNQTAVPQKFTVSIASDGVVASSTPAAINATTTPEFIADTHSQRPDPSTLRVFYQNGNYYLQEIENQTFGEQGTSTIYADQTTTTPLAVIGLGLEGHFLGSGLVSVGSQYHPSVWLDIKDALGHPTSTRVKFDLPSLPKITSVKAFTDRIIFKTSKNLRGEQAMDCSNYTVAGSVLSCTGPGFPFIEFFGNQVAIKGLNLPAGNQISFSVSGIQEIDPEGFPLNYSTSTLLVNQVAIPIVDSISPRSATSGASVVISGSNFGSAPGTVLFSGGFDPQTGPKPPVEASTTAWTNTSITAIVPSTAKSGPVQIISSDGIMSDINEASFFDVLTDVYFKVVNGTTSNPVTTSTNIRIFVGSPQSENIYFDGDAQGTIFDNSTYVYKVPHISSMGFVWAYDASGYYLPAFGQELQQNTSSTNPMILTFQGTTTRTVSGNITLGTSCTSEGQNKWVAVMALPKGMEGEPGPGGIQPSFFKTNSNCTTSYALALPGTGTSTFRIESHIPPFVGSASTLMDPPAKLVTVSDTNPTASLNFTFSQADRKVYGRIVGANEEALESQKYQELWVFAFQPKENGKSTATRPDNQGYFSVYVTEGVYKIGVGGPMMPFPIEKEITVDSSAKFNLNSTTTAITIKLEPPTTYIEGYVKDETGNGISGVDIFAWCEGAPGGGHAFTDSQGYYKMYVSPCSNYHVGGFAENYGQLTEQSGITVSQNSNPTVNFTLASADFITVSGQVTKNSSPVTNADIWITKGQFGPGLGWSRTEADGSYQITLKKGETNLYLHAATPGKGEFSIQQLNSGQALNTSTTVNISVNTATLEIHLSPGNTFEEAFIGAHSSIGAGFTDVRLATSTNYDTYKLEVPYAGGGTVYTIEGGIPGFGPIPATSTLISGNKIVNIDLGSISFYTVSGTVTATGTLATSSDAFVWAGGPQGGGGTRVNSDGTFSLKLRTGPYDIGVGKAGYTGSVLRSQNVNSDISNLNLTLTKNDAEISGKVMFGSSPVANVRVWASNGKGGWSGTVSEADGSFILNVGSGEWLVEAAGDGYQSSPIRITAPVTDLTVNVSQVEFNPERREQSITPVEGGVIQTDDAKVELPSGALGSDSTKVSVKIQKTMSVPEGNGVKVFSGKAKEISASYSEGNNKGRAISVLNDNANIEIVLSKAELIAEGISSLESAKKLKIGYFDETAGNWVEIKTVVKTDPSNATWDSLNSITLKGATNHFSDFAPIYPTEGAPSTPTGLTASAGDGEITLSWNASTGASKYYIYRKSGSQYPFLATTTQTSYTDTGLTNGTTYYYKVSAANAADQESAATEAVSATPVASTGGGGGGGGVVQSASNDITPPSISDIAVNAGVDSVVVSWQTSEPSISWILYGTSTDYTSEIKTQSFTTSHSLTLSGLLGSTVYHYQIKAKDEAGNVSFYTDRTFTTLNSSEKVGKEIKKEAQKPVAEMTIEELKAEIARITTLIAQLQAQLAQLQKESKLFVRIPPTFRFEKNLKFGDVSDDVKYLQIVLNTDVATQLAETGEGSPGNETRYFGPLTKEAVIKFQEKYASEILAPWNLTSGTGFVGKTTRAKLNEILGR